MNVGGQVRTLAERRALIASLLKDHKDTKRTFPLLFRGKQQYFPIISVSTEYLLYRTENYRTSIAQLLYLDEHRQASPDLFKDEESSEAQNAQHGLLLKMVDEMGLRQDMLKHGQYEPLVITHTGVVVNGNRRLAVMREKPVDYAEAIVLPSSTTQEEIYTIEVELQLKRDFTSKYDWVAQLLAVSQGVRKFQFDKKRDLAELLNLPSPQEVTLRLTMLDMVDAYLARAGRPGAYHLVSAPRQLEEAFRTIVKQTAKLATVEEKDAFRNRAFTLIDNPPEEGRLYDHLNSLANNFTELRAREASTLTVATTQSARDQQPDENDPLENLEASSNSPQSEAVEEQYRSPDAAGKIAPEFVEILSDVTDEAKEKGRGLKALNYATQALSKLQSLSIDESTQDLIALGRQLDQIQKRLTRLQQELGKRMTAGH